MYTAIPTMATLSILVANVFLNSQKIGGKIRPASPATMRREPRYSTVFTNPRDARFNLFICDILHTCDTGITIVLSCELVKGILQTMASAQKLKILPNKSPVSRAY